MCPRVFAHRDKLPILVRIQRMNATMSRQQLTIQPPWHSTLESLRGLFVALCFAFASSAHATVPVEVVALFKDAAVLRGAGGQEMLRVGQTGARSGVKLLAADTQRARVQFEGETYELGLSNHVSTAFKARTQESVRVSRDNLGQYRLRGSINGHFVNFLVDTGASVVAMSEAQAQTMGLSYRDAQRGRVETAQGVTDAFFLPLSSVTIGGITLTDVQGTVIRGNHPTEVLLGMSFLGQVRMQDDAGVLTITAKY